MARPATDRSTRPQSSRNFSRFRSVGRVSDGIDFLFSPRRTEAARRAEQRQQRQTKVQPSQQDRRNPNAKRTIHDHYSAESYARAIRRAAQKSRRSTLVPLPAPPHRRHPNSPTIRAGSGTGHSGSRLNRSLADLCGARFNSRNGNRRKRRVITGEKRPVIWAMDRILRPDYFAHLPTLTLYGHLFVSPP